MKVSMLGIFTAGVVTLAGSWSFAAPAADSPKPGGVQVEVKPPSAGGGVQIDTKPRPAGGGVQIDTNRPGTGGVQVEATRPGAGGVQVEASRPGAGGVQVETNRPGAPKDGDRANIDIRNPRTGQPLVQGSFDGSWRNRLRDERGDYRWQNFRGADIGLWFNRNSSDGLIVSDVGTTGAIAKLGFQEGDRIVSVNGQRVVREGDFSRLLFAQENRAGRVNVIILRDGREQTIAVEPRLFMEEFTNYQSDPLDRVGLIIDDRASDRIVVTRVAPYSPAYYAGIRAGDVIVSFRGQPVRDAATFGRLFDRLEPGSVAIEVNRNNKARKLDLEIEGDRQTLLKPEVNGAGTPAAERREELREERRDDRKERIENRQPAPPRTTEIEVTPPKTGDR